MTNNIDRAAEVIGQLTGGGELGRNAAQAIARHLADASLLSPDLPEPTGDFPYWKVLTEDGEQDALIHLVGKTIVFRLEDGTRTAFALTRDEARGVARALLAAAEHAQKEETNE